MDGVDDSGAAASHAPMNRLSELQVRIHARSFVEKPRAQMRRRVLRVALVLRQLPGGDERRHLHAQSHQVPPMIDKIVRVRHSVTLNVWPIWIFRVWPPVIRLGKEVMQSPSTARTRRRRDRDRLF